MESFVPQVVSTIAQLTRLWYLIALLFDLVLNRTLTDTLGPMKNRLTVKNIFQFQSKTRFKYLGLEKAGTKIWPVCAQRFPFATTHSRLRPCLKTCSGENKLFRFSCGGKKMTFSCGSLDYFIFPLEHRKNRKNGVCANLCFFGFHGSQKNRRLRSKTKLASLKNVFP